MENISKKKGFTLVEMLLVISIIAMLAAVAVGGYSSYRRNTLLDLSADAVVAQISEFKARTFYGSGEEEEIVTKCFGFNFEKNGDEIVLKKFEQEYIDKKDLIDGQIRVKGCEGSDGLSETGFFELDEQVKVVAVFADELEVTNFDDLELKFLPPQAVLDFEGVNEDTETLRIIFQFAEVAERQREVVIDLSSGKAIKQRI